MRFKSLGAVFGVLILVGTIFTAAMPSGATKIDTTASGAGYLDIVFPDGGGYSTSASIKVPFNVYVLEALLALEGKPSPFNGSLSWKGKADLMKAMMTNITIINGNLVLDKLFKNWTSPAGWSGADLKNLTLDKQKAILAKMVGTYFLPNIKVDPDGIANPDTSDIAIDKNGNIHVIYVDFKMTPTMNYVRSADGGLTWTVIKTFSANGFQWPHLYVGPNGYIHIFYNIVMMGGSPLLYQRSKDNGTTFESVAWTFKPQNVHAAFDAKGGMHFAGIMALSYPPFESRLYYWNSTDNGTSQSLEVQVSDDIDNLSLKDGVSLAVDSKGKVHIIWQDFRDNVNGDDGEVFYSGSADHVTFSQNIAIEGRTAVFGGSTDMVIDSQDVIHVVWADNSLGDQEIFYTHSTDSGGHFIPSKTINTVSAGDQAFPSAALGPDGSLQIVWGSGLDISLGDIIYTRSDDQGTTFSQEMIINALAEPAQQYPMLVVDKDGLPNLILSDSTSGGYDLYFSKAFTPYAKLGEITGIADLGLEPSELQHVIVTASFVIGTEVRLSLRSSNDNTTWSQWEEVDLDDETFQTPAGRYVNYHILLLSKDLVTTPSVTSIKFDFSQYKSQGEWVSDAVLVSHGLKDATLNWNTTQGALMTVFVSNDNGTTWSQAFAGQKVTFPTVKDQLKLKVLFTSSGGVSSELSKLTVGYTSTVYPTDLDLDLGMDGTQDWNMTGELTSKVQVNIIKVLSNFLKAYQGGLDPVPVVLKFSSKTAGVLTVSNISIVVDLPPIINSWEPATDAPQMGQGTTMTYKVVATDPDGSALNYKWFINGTAVPGITGPEFVFNATFDKIGNYIIKVEVNDGRYTLNKTWTLEVKATNRPPVIISYEPQNTSFERFDGVPTNFSITATDPDKDALIFSWSVDGVTVPKAAGNSWNLDYKLAPIGKTYKIQVIVSDGELRVNKTWDVTVKSYGLPKISSWTPLENVSMNKGKSVTLGIVATHPNGLGLIYSWYIDGQFVTNASLKDYTFVGKTAGTHTVKVVVSDGKRTAEHTWTVTVKEKKSSGTSMLLLYGLGALLVIVAVMIAVSVIWRSGRKDKK